MALNSVDIEKLSKRKGAKATSVQNFLGSLSGLTASEAYGNLTLDARGYSWNAATVNAIRAGIERHYKP